MNLKLLAMIAAAALKALGLKPKPGKDVEPIK